MKQSYFIYSFICLLYGFVGYTATGFDDELFNITIVETLSFSQMIDFIQSSDAHPPISYIFNKLLFSIFNDWKVVRLVTALLFSSAICYAIAETKKRNGINSSILIFLLLGLQPAMLMWGTSLRWYAIFVGVLTWVSFTPTSKSIGLYWTKFILGSILLLYTGYIAMLILPGLAWIYYSGMKGGEKRKLTLLTISGIIIFIVFIPQLLIFKSVHFKAANSQFYSFISNLQGVFISQFSNQGLFPITFFAIISAIGFLVLWGVEFHNLLKNKLNENALPYFSTIILIVAAGIAGRFRSLVVANPFQAIWITELTKKNSSRLVKCAIALIVISNIAGLINVSKHKDTTKSNWNIPMKQILNLVQKEGIQGKTVVYCHDPILSYQLEKSGYPVLGPYYINKKKYTSPSAAVVVVVKTNQGVIPYEKYHEMLNEIIKLEYKEKKTLQFGEDKHYELKRKIDPTFPKYAAELVVYRDVTNLPQHSSWEWSSGIYSRIRKFSTTPVKQ